MEEAPRGEIAIATCSLSVIYSPFLCDDKLLPEAFFVLLGGSARINITSPL